MHSFAMIGVKETGHLEPDVAASNIVGLGTYGLRTCVAVIIIGEKSKRISLTHHVGGEDRNYSSILKEIEWVGSPVIIRLVKNSEGMRRGLSEIRDQLGIKTEDDYAKHDTEKLIINFLRENQLIKMIKSRMDSKSGKIFVNRHGELMTGLPENTQSLYAEGAALKLAVTVLNEIYAGPSLAPPELVFDGGKFRDETLNLNVRAHHILSLIACQLRSMQCDYTLENIYQAVVKIDLLVKTVIGNPSGVLLSGFGGPSPHRDNLLGCIKTIITSGKMPEIQFDARVMEAIEGKKRSHALTQ